MPLPSPLVGIFYPSLDVPQVTSVIVEDPDPIGPVGVKGIGEPAMIPTIPAVMNAFEVAVGVRITAPETGKSSRSDPSQGEGRAAFGRGALIRRGVSVASDVAVAARRAGEKKFSADLSAIREMSAVLPGALPVAINGVKVAASIRARKFVIAGGDDTPVTMPRTAFQIVYPDCTLMLDSGLDKATHDSFSPEPEPYYPEQFAALARALDAARLIVLTHHHADHVGGVVTAANFATLAKKTIITMDVADCLMNTPHRPHLELSQETVARFIVLDYPHYYPVAPGVVLIRSPGHSVDSQMVYIRLQSGQEILHSVDAAWVMDNIREVKGKAAPWVKEDVPAVIGQLRWLKGIAETEKDLTILVTHDDELFERLTGSGVIGAGLAS